MRSAALIKYWTCAFAVCLSFVSVCCFVCVWFCGLLRIKDAYFDEWDDEDGIVRVRKASICVFVFLLRER